MAVRKHLRHDADTAGAQLLYSTVAKMEAADEQNCSDLGDVPAPADQPSLWKEREPVRHCHQVHFFRVLCAWRCFSGHYSVISFVFSK